MRLPKKVRPRWAERLRFWLVDGQFEWIDWGERRFGLKIVDKVNRLQERLLEEPGKKLLCALFDHEPEADHCGRPEHDLCGYCGKLMPGQALGPPGIIERRSRESA